jgi:hypothetical protein
MWLDGHQAPPIPGRLIVRKPRPSPRRGFPFWVRSQFELRPHLPPREGAGSCSAPSRSAVPLIYGEATVAPPRSPAGIRRISEDDGEKMPVNSPIERLHVAPPHDTPTPCRSDEFEQRHRCLLMRGRLPRLPGKGEAAAGQWLHG